MSAPRFLLDEMLGKLARDLRALGYDAEYRKHVEDDEILEGALTADRVLLTRDQRLADRAGDQGLLVASRDPGEQLAAVVERLELSPSEEAFLSRCLECNVALESARAPDAVPASVKDSQHYRCPACERIYWEGTHVEDMRARLGAYLEDSDP